MTRGGRLTLWLAAAMAAAGGVATASAAPETTITAGPQGRTGDTSPSFAFQASDPAATFECSLDGTAFTACTSPWTFAGVTESPHTFAARAIGPDGSADPTPAERSFVADAHVEATVSAPRIQHPAERVGVALRVDADEPVSVTGRGTIKVDDRSFDLTRVQTRARRGRTVISLVPGGAQESSEIARALARGESAKAAVKLVLVDSLANLERFPVSVRLTAG